jgi:hypothetical protein
LQKRQEQQAERQHKMRNWHFKMAGGTDHKNQLKRFRIKKRAPTRLLIAQPAVLKAIRSQHSRYDKATMARATITGDQNAGQPYQ